ncbi:hypothetical protein [uncultured Victivallis sp.]|uniref:hypothetical protein n=1 Tax=uncultured Victivallis sp. TaxID=354118 RepID=UPI0025992C4E|nr:hypothetical protein [uncultured Victivallis sp.]
MATVCKITLDAAEYRKELEAVVAESRAAAGSLANLPDRQVSVTADTTQAKAAVEELAQTPTPEIDVPVTDDDAPLETVREELEQTDAAARKTGGILAKLIPVSLREQAAQAFGAIREEMNKTRGGAGNFLGKFLAGGGAIGIIAAGIASLGKIAVTAYRNWINGMKEAGELAQRNAANIREAAEANEQLRQKSDGYLSRLSELSSAEQLSNANKAEARKLIADLTKSYGDLGVKLDETTGKLSGVDEAMVKKLQRDKDRRIAEMETELRQLQSDNAAQAQVRDNAGIKIWGRRGQVGGFFKELSFGGEADAKEAGQKIAENAKRINELRKQIHEQRRADPVAEYRAKRQAENADLAKGNQERNRSFGQRKSDDAFNAAKDIDVKIANRRQGIDAERSSRQRVEAEAALGSAQTDYEKAKSAGDRDGMLDAEKRILQAKQAILASDEKIYAFEQQIDTLNRQRAEAVKKITDQAKYELDYNKLIAAAEFEKAAVLKLEKELKDQNLKLSEEEKKKILEQREALQKQDTAKQIAEAKEEVALQQLLVDGNYEAYEAEKLRLEMKRQGKKLTEEETQELLEQRKALKELNLRQNLQEQAYGLYGEAMTKAGRGREFEEQKALRDARKAKGGELSEEETAMVKQLSAISYAMANTRETSLGDTSVKTNSLTARGGFAGGAKLPESDKINREIANTNKQQLEQMKQIAAICEKLGTF